MKKGILAVGRSSGMNSVYHYSNGKLFSVSDKTWCKPRNGQDRDKRFLIDTWEILKRLPKTLYRLLIDSLVSW